jgi:hypothetical protein
MPKPEARTRRPQIATVGAPRGARPRSQGDARRLASASACRSTPGVPRVSAFTRVLTRYAPRAVSALHPPLVRGRMQRMGSTRTQTASRERKVLREMPAKEATMRLTTRMAMRRQNGGASGRPIARSRRLRGVGGIGRVGSPALVLRFEARHLQELAEQGQPMLARHGGEIGGHRGHVVGYGAPVDELLAVRWVGHSAKHAPFCPATTPPLDCGIRK